MGKIYVMLAIGVLAASQSANIIRIGDANPFSMTAWRLAMACMILAPLALREPRNMTQRSWRPSMIAGTCLAIHFFTWIYAVQNVSVAVATLVLGVNPVFLVVIEALFFRSLPSKAQMKAMLLFIGSALILLTELDGISGSIHGWLAGLGSAFAFSLYLIAGRKAQECQPPTFHLLLCYGVAAFLGFLMSLMLGKPILAFSTNNWLCFALLAFIPTLLGHSSFNIALKYLPASLVAASTLAEPVLAILGAWYFWGEAVSWIHLLSFILVCGGFYLSQSSGSGVNN
ncbi:MAG: EamA family transporter [Pseudobacteriovorax sp.]|nr:EamA family transporter [Pseudobacteriovorax sp.]